MDNALPAASSHVSRRLVTDFDYLNLPGHEEDVHLAWSRLHALPDIFWTPRHGGHWVATRAEDTDVIEVDYRSFSLRSVTIPPTPGDHARLAPLEYDPPEHTPLRAILNPAFGPKPMQALEGQVRLLTMQLLDKIAPAGSCEFIADFAKILPIVTFLKLVDIPLSDRGRLLALADMVTRPRNDDERNDGFAQLKRYTEGWIIERRARPGPDLFSRIVNGQIDGEPLDDVQTEGMLSTVLFGGLDTVASTLGFITKSLAEQPDVRHALASELKLIPVAIEEFLRRFAIPNSARVITHDLDYKGLYFKEGEHIPHWTSTSGCACR